MPLLSTLADAASPPLTLQGAFDALLGGLHPKLIHQVSSFKMCLGLIATDILLRQGCCFSLATKTSPPPPPLQPPPHPPPFDFHIVLGWLIDNGPLHFNLDRR
jgi:hypothetical protein